MDSLIDPQGEPRDLRVTIPNMKFLSRNRLTSNTQFPLPLSCCDVPIEYTNEKFNKTVTYSVSMLLKGHCYRTAYKCIYGCNSIIMSFRRATLRIFSKHSPEKLRFQTSTDGPLGVRLFSVGQKSISSL